MNKNDLIIKLESLLQNPDLAAIASDVKALQNEYLHILNDTKTEQVEDFVASGGIRKEYEYRKDADDLKIETLFTQYRELKRKFDQQKTETEKNNLTAKKAIIEQINSLVNEENIGKAVATFKELTTKWKETGAVHFEKFRELQNDYSKALESFNYNLKIYKEIKDYDYKKNFENKIIIVQKISELVNKDSIKEIEDLLQALRSEWDEVGPVLQEKWAELRDEYRKTMDLVYERLNHLKEIRTTQRQENLKLKEAVSDKIEKIVTEIPTTLKGWNNRTEEIKKLQEEWLAIAKAEKAKEEQAHERMRSLSNKFFDLKRTYYTELKEVFEKNKPAKEAIVAKAQALKESTQWKETADKLIKLQKEWAAIGPVAQQTEKILWNKFREACNSFFEARTAATKEKENAFAANTELKKNLLNELKSFIPSDNHTETRQNLLVFKNRWMDIGSVTFAERKTLNDEFFKLLDTHFEKIQLSSKDREIMKAQNKIDRFLASENAQELIQKEVDFIRKKINELQIDILKYENNLGFLKNAESLRKEALSKIESTKKSVDELKERIKPFQKALRDINKPKEKATSEISVKE